MDSFPHIMCVLHMCVLSCVHLYAHACTRHAEIVVEGTGEVVGTLRSSSGDVGIVHLKLSAAAAAEAGKAVLRLKVVNEQGAGLEADSSLGSEVRPYRPAWWPQEWGTEEAEREGGTA